MPNEPNGPQISEIDTPATGPGAYVGTTTVVAGRDTTPSPAADGLGRPLRSNVTLYRAAAVLLLLLVLVLCLKQLDFYQVGMEWDDAQYVQLAQSIVLRRPYVVDTGSGVTFPTRYPFGFPLILAPVYALSNGSFEALKLVSLVFTLATVVLIIAGWEYLGLPSRRFGLAVAALYALSPLVATMSREVMSEPTFTFFVLLGLIITIRVSLDTRVSLAWSIGLGAVWLFASNVRIIGCAFVAASILYLVLRRKWPALTLSVLGFVVSLGLIVAITSLRWSDAYNVQIYLDEFSGERILRQTGTAAGLIPRAWQGATAYLGYLRDTLVPFVESPLLQAWLARHGLAPVLGLVSGFVLILVVVGYAENLRNRYALPSHVFVAIYAAITIVWPYRGDRFLFGIVPFLFAYLLIGGDRLVRVVIRRAGRVTRRRVSLAASGIVTLFIGIQLAASVRTESWVHHTRDFEVGAAWIRANAPADSLVIADHNEIIYLYARRATGALPDDATSLDPSLARQRPVYLLIAPEIEWSPTGALRYTRQTDMFLDALKTGALSADLVYANEPAMVLVYRLRPVISAGH